jgi:hypothetical protein
LFIKNERLLRQLREAESSAINRLAGESSGVSSAEVAKLELQLRQAKNALEDTRSELDRIKQSSSGSEKDKAVMQQQLSGEMSQIKFVVPFISSYRLLILHDVKASDTRPTT